VVACGDGRGAAAAFDGLELESGGLTTTRHGHGEEEKSREREWSDPWGFALWCQVGLLRLGAREDSLKTLRCE